jgi:glycosyltransferase involved in cell wall biosynthesis
LEYLKDTFSRVAKKDDVKAYAAYMEEFLNLATNEKSRWLAMRDEAKRAARKNFSKEVYIQKIKAILQKHD